MAKENESTTPPKETEQTGPQSTAIGNNMVGGVMVGMPGVRVPAGTFRTYRQMRSNPTIALARAAAMTPVRGAKWSVGSKPGTPDEWVKEIDDALSPLWMQLIKDMLYALDYGFASFEKVFKVENNLVSYSKIKALLVDITTILADPDTGDFAGLQQGKVELPSEKAVLYTYDGEAGDLYGRSRHENDRKVWAHWNDTLVKSGQYVNKAAGVIPMIEYPMDGRSTDATGAEIDNHVHAATMLAQLGKGNGVYMPNTLAKYAEDLARAGVDISQLRAWQISFLETKGQHGREIVDLMRYDDSLLLRGWLVPERSATEGQYGTKAESETHANLTITISYLLLLEIVSVINQQIIDPLLRFNHGSEAVGQVYIVPEELGSDEQHFFRGLLKEVFANPQNIDLFLNILDVGSLMDLAGLPKSEAIDISKAADEAAARTQSAQIPASLRMGLMKLYDNIANGRTGLQKVE